MMGIQDIVGIIEAVYREPYQIGEGGIEMDYQQFRPTPRTDEQIAERDVSIEECIATEMLRTDHDTFGVYLWAEQYVQAVIGDRNFAQPLPTDIIQRMESVEDPTTRDNGLARLYLADAVVRHRLTGFSGGTATTDLGFGIFITTSLAAEIVNYHRRIVYVR